MLEKLEIAFWLDKTREYLGPDHPAVKALFGSKSSLEIAGEIVASSPGRATPPSAKGCGTIRAQIGSSSDPAIALVRRIDEAARAARARYEAGVTGPASVAAEKIASLRFDVLGQSIYPDATFTLRLSYGVVKGWNDPVHGQVKPFTYVSGLWDRATGAYPFNLGAKWVGQKSKIRRRARR